MTNYLLDPKNDYVFKRLFSGAPELLVSLINDLRPDLPAVTSVEVLNPTIEASELTGKYIILDVLAKDSEGHQYNIEMQVRRYHVWGARSLYYLARMLSDQLDAGRDYRQLKSAVGIHLLDFDLFTDNPEQQGQAVWRFEMRDQQIPAVVLSDQLQLNIIELKKADRLAPGSESLKAWITFFEHWQEDALMANITHEPVKQAIGRIRELSADEEEKRLAFVRERALHDEATLMVEAKEEGIEIGYEKAKAEAQEEKGIGIATLLKLGLADKHIAEALQVTEEQVQKARDELLH